MPTGHKAAQDQWTEVVADLVEVASGGKSDRPVLAEALELCRKQKATLLVAKLDRLSRQVSFVANLLEEKGVEFVVASLPHASHFELHLEPTPPHPLGPPLPLPHPCSVAHRAAGRKQKGRSSL